jgi:hypothetical protein
MPISECFGHSEAYTHECSQSEVNADAEQDRERFAALEESDWEYVKDGRIMTLRIFLCRLSIEILLRLLVVVSISFLKD